MVQSYADRWANSKVKVKKGGKIIRGNNYVDDRKKEETKYKKGGSPKKKTSSVPTVDFKGQTTLENPVTQAFARNAENVIASQNSPALPQTVSPIQGGASSFTDLRDNLQNKLDTFREAHKLNKPGEVTGGMVVGPSLISVPGAWKTALAGLKSVSDSQALAQLYSGGIKTATDVGKIAQEVGRVGDIASNSRTARLVEVTLKKRFSDTALQIAGAWAGAVMLGQWGQAEAAEPISVAMNKYLIPNAQKTGNWELVDEAVLARDEILNLEEWEKIALWSPLSPAIGIVNKIKGAIAGAKITDKIIEDARIQAETGESDDEKWARLREEQYARDLAIRDENDAHYAEIERLRREAEVANRNEDAKFWSDYARRKEEDLAKARKAEADFWSAYYKQVAKQREDTSPSKLNFGLI